MLLQQIKNIEKSDLLFLAGICLSSLAASPYALDFGLSIRFIFLSFFLGFSFLFGLRTQKSESGSINFISLIYLVYTLYCISSIYWANTVSETIFEGLKLLMGFLVFNQATKLKTLSLANLFYQFCTLLPFIGLAFAVSQFLKLEEWSKVSLYEISGLNGHKNLFSSFLFLNMYFIFQNMMNEKNKNTSIASLSVSLILIAILQTKAVWIAIIASVLFFLTLKFLLPFLAKRKINFWITTLFLLITLNIFTFFALPYLVEKGLEHNAKIEHSKEERNQLKELDNERLVLWNKTLKMHEATPLKGVGLGNWQIFLGQQNLSGLYRAEDLNYTFQRPHNDFLWILSETGIIGFELYLLFITSLLALAVKQIKESEKKEQVIKITGISFVMGYLLISFFDFPKERIEHLVWINLIMGTLLSSSNIEKSMSVFLLKTTFNWQRVAVLICVISLAIGCLRYKGEYYTRLIYEAKDSGQMDLIPELKEKAVSFAYQIDPTSVPISWYSGNAYLQKGNTIKALIEFRSAYTQNPYNRHVANDLGSVYLSLNQTSKAKNYFNEALTISPRFDHAALNLSSLLISEKDTLSAGKILRTMYHSSRKRTNLLQILELMKSDTTLNRP